MSEFPRTMVGGVSVSRMIIGTNWFLGYTHCTWSKSRSVERIVTNPQAIADIIAVFLRAGVDTIMCPHTTTCMYDAIREAEQRVGRKVIIIETPSFPTNKRTPFEGFDISACERILDAEVQKGVAISMPHTSTTDVMVDKCTREIRQMDVICRLIRERGMIPGLSTHMPETVVYADKMEADVETYIQIYNAAGFLMQVEVDWVQRIIRDAKKPVMTIKPLAAGRLMPIVGFAFVWNTIRDCDMVTIGTTTPDEARESIEMSLDLLARRMPQIELQKTRSKSSLS